MREKDIKILWGRSGNRCAICKLELTSDGAPETLGEMAHIVARSPEGPRGAVQLANEDRETYENLILLCPNHHSEIDKNPDAWPIHRLKVAKTDHERWVSERFQAGKIAVQPLDNSGFIEARRQEWASLAQEQVAIAVSVSPLRAAYRTVTVTGWK
jgi:hypothetical protein